MKPIRVSQHAVDRYRERVKPALDADQAFHDLVRCVRFFAVVVDDLPDWAWALPEGVEPDAELRQEHVGVAMIGDDIALPLVDGGNCLLAITCLTRAGLPEGARAYVNRRNAAKRARRQSGREKHHDKSQRKRAKRAGEERAA